MSHSALPGVPMIDFDISHDGQQVAFTARSGSDFQIFVAPLDGSAPPRRVVGGGDSVNFGRAGELIFRQLERIQLPCPGQNGWNRFGTSLSRCLKWASCHRTETG